METTANVKQQYDSFSKDFIDNHEKYHTIARPLFYSLIDFDVKGKELLDVACGNGYDLRRMMQRGAVCAGIDESIEMVNSARQLVPGASIMQGDMEEMPYEDSQFDVVLSKYAIQTSRDVPRVLKEVVRVTKPGGRIIFLVTHPFRQFMEKTSPKDYFKQDTVECHFFEGKVTAYEPSHTMMEYLNDKLLDSCRLERYREDHDFPSAERIEGHNYPGFFVARFKKDQ